jgi:hypothetical protein
MPERYGPPPRRGRRLVLIAVTALVAAGGLAWLLWAATLQSTPDVAAGVTGFDVVSDSRTDVTLEVERRVAGAVRCTVYAQAPDTSIVGEREALLDAAEPGTISATVSIATERRATSATVRECTLD